MKTYFPTRTGIYRAVDGVDFTVEPGETLCIVGESGSGKSVTALSIIGLVDSPGHVMKRSEVIFDGREITGLREADKRRIQGKDIAMVFQEPMTSLNPVFTVGWQIAESLRVNLGLSRREARQRTIETMELVGIPSSERRIDAYPHQLSGGLRQRVMIAIALCCRPRLLIADEPTTALDVTIQAQILELLKDLQARLGMAMLLITHDMGVVAEMGDSVAVMYGGKIVEKGPVETVLTHPQHPYTEALLASVPVLSNMGREPLRVIKGTVPDSSDWPHGCRFAPRCDYTFGRCLEQPPLFATPHSGEAACWLRQTSETRHNTGGSDHAR